MLYERLEVMCDCGASVENIERFAINAKYAFSFKEMSDKSILISLQKA
jgi:TusA-related sulfurtransferase